MCKRADGERWDGLRANAEQRQRAQVVVDLVGTMVVAVALGYQFYSWWSGEKAEEERHSDARSQQLECNRATRNNHDHLKVKHETQRDAQAVVARMRQQGREGSERLNAYYNEERKGWYVGKGRHSLSRQ